jgi:hypothetical protein
MYGSMLACGEVARSLQKKLSSGAKEQFFSRPPTARLKSCPDTKHEFFAASRAVKPPIYGLSTRLACKGVP